MKKLLNESISNNLSHVHSKAISSEHILVPKTNSDMEIELVAGFFVSSPEYFGRFWFFGGRNS